MPLRRRIVVPIWGVAVLLLALLPLQSASGVVLYEYNFDNASLLNGGTASDGTLVVSPGESNSNAPGFVESVTDSNGLTFSHVYDYSTGDASAGDKTAYHFSNIANQPLTNSTISLWARTDDVTPPSQFSSVFMNDSIQINNTAGEYRIRAGNELIGTVQNDTWQHIAVTFDGTDTRVYLDGGLTGTFAGNLGNNNVFNEIGIGTNRARDNNGRFLGHIDQVFVDDNALSAGQIAAVFAAGPAPAPLSVDHNIGVSRRARIRDNGRNNVEINGGTFIGDAGNDADNRMLFHFDTSAIANGPLTFAREDGTLSIQLNSTQGGPDSGDFFDLYLVDENNAGWITSGDVSWNDLTNGTLWKDGNGVDLPSGAGNPAAPGSADGGLGAPGDGYFMLIDSVNQASYTNGEVLTWTIPADVLQELVDGNNAGFFFRKRNEGDDGRLQFNGGTAVLAFTTAGAIPEPTTATLGLIGLAGLLVRRRRAA